MCMPKENMAAENTEFKEEKTMTKTQVQQIKEQLPAETRILRTYQAFEGDIRVIVQLPGGNTETRYTISFDEDDYPHIKLMP